MSVVPAVVIHCTILNSTVNLFLNHSIEF